MCLATVNREKPWASTVFFAYDKKENFLFFSRPDTKHAQYIGKNPHVAGTINQDWGGRGEIKGIQFHGTARIVLKSEQERAYKIFQKRYSWASRFQDHSLYSIKPIEMYYIDSKRFGHHFRVRVF